MKLLLDACALYPTVIRNLLLDVSDELRWDLNWSERILEEWRRASAKTNAEAEVQAAAEEGNVFQKALNLLGLGNDQELAIEQLKVNNEALSKNNNELKTNKIAVKRVLKTKFNGHIR